MFLLVRVVKDEVVMIARKKDLHLLDIDNLQLFCDGTFKFSPRHFKQMYTFFVFKDGFYIPVAHFLLQNKLLRTYKKTLQLLREQCALLGFNLQNKLNSVMMDFEWAMIKAFKITFKNCQIQGCRFHLGQSWWRKIKELGLAKEYKNVSSRTGRWLRGVFGISLLPSEMVDRVFKSYVKNIRNPCAKTKKMIAYLSDFYMCTKSKFPPGMWAGIKGKKTNNGAEAFHRAFGDLFGYLRSKPDIWHFLRNMKRFNTIKSIKMRSKKKATPVYHNQDEHIEAFKKNKTRVGTLLHKLAIKNQPKTRLTYKRKFY